MNRVILIDGYNVSDEFQIGQTEIANKAELNESLTFIYQLCENPKNALYIPKESGFEPTYFTNLKFSDSSMTVFFNVFKKVEEGSELKVESIIGYKYNPNVEPSNVFGSEESDDKLCIRNFKVELTDSTLFNIPSSFTTTQNGDHIIVEVPETDLSLTTDTGIDRKELKIEIEMLQQAITTINTLCPYAEESKVIYTGPKGNNSNKKNVTYPVDLDYLGKRLNKNKIVDMVEEITSCKDPLGYIDETLQLPLARVFSNRLQKQTLAIIKSVLLGASKEELFEAKEKFQRVFVLDSYKLYLSKLYDFGR